MLSQEPILALVTIYLSVVYGVLYAREFLPVLILEDMKYLPIHLVFEAFPIVFMEVRGFTIGQSGLIFIGVGIGTTLGAVLNVWQSRHYGQLITRWKGFPPPEYRLTGAMVGAPLLVVGAFWLGWTGQYASVPWYVPGLATIVLGGGIALIFMSFLVCFLTHTIVGS
jgi:MFS transporter, DHA1 family, multidrug resistance protein